ncbi:hypothetical protein G6F35_017944 [Rhizopus arrhizus]|nr:hypothetical protein G6F35_017944 [Rhizopus arrhizus]
MLHAYQRGITASTVAALDRGARQGQFQLQRIVGIAAFGGAWPATRLWRSAAQRCRSPARAGPARPWPMHPGAATTARAGRRRAHPVHHVPAPAPGAG